LGVREPDRSCTNTRCTFRVKEWARSSRGLPRANCDQLPSKDRGVGRAKGRGPRPRPARQRSSVLAALADAVRSWRTSRSSSLPSSKHRRDSDDPQSARHESASIPHANDTDRLDPEIIPANFEDTGKLRGNHEQIYPISLSWGRRSARQVVPFARVGSPHDQSWRGCGHDPSMA
jgi:hypothetical protein